MMSCFTPFISEFLYLNLRNGFESSHENYQESIHYLRLPHSNEKLVNAKISTSVGHMKKLVELARKLRDMQGVPLKKPVRKVVIINSCEEITESLALLHNYFESEINTLEIVEASDVENYVTYDIEFNHRSLGQRLERNYTQSLRQNIANMGKEKISELMEAGNVDINGTIIYLKDVHLHKVFQPEIIEKEGMHGITNEEYALLIDFNEDEEIQQVYAAREFINKIQKFRKDLELNIEDNVEIYYSTQDLELENILENQQLFIEKTILKPFKKLEIEISTESLQKIEFSIGNWTGNIYILKKN